MYSKTHHIALLKKSVSVVHVCPQTLSKRGNIIKYILQTVQFLKNFNWSGQSIYNILKIKYLNLLEFWLKLDVFGQGHSKKSIFYPCVPISHIVLRFGETHVTHISIQSLKFKKNVFELSLSHITWSLPNHYWKTWRFSPSKNWWFREFCYWCLNIILVLCQNLFPHYLQKKVKFIVIILEIVARFIQRLVNLKQHIELLLIMQF